MSRFYQPIDKEAFEAKITEVFAQHRKSGRFSNTITKDISKINFDFENFTDDTDDSGFSTYPHGINTLAPDFHVFFAAAGGDWEFPVCYALYWDGKQIRGYVPTEGNAWNRKTKEAHGNGSEGEDGELDDEAASKTVDATAIIEDIKGRIKRKGA